MSSVTVSQQDGGFQSWMECMLVSVSLTKSHLLIGKDGWENERSEQSALLHFPGSTGQPLTSAWLTRTHKLHTLHSGQKHTLHKNRHLSLVQNINSRRTNIFLYQTVMCFFTDVFLKKQTPVSQPQTHTAQTHSQQLNKLSTPWNLTLHAQSFPVRVEEILPFFYHHYNIFSLTAGPPIPVKAEQMMHVYIFHFWFSVKRLSSDILKRDSLENMTSWYSAFWKYSAPLNFSTFCHIFRLQT